MKDPLPASSQPAWLRWLLATPTLKLVLLFLLLDALAAFLFWLKLRGVLDSRFFHLARDRGFAEIVQYLKCGGVIAVLWAWRRVRLSRLLGAWILLFTVMLLDDAIGIHEEGGEWLLRWVDIPAPEGVRPKDLAEAVLFALVEGSALLYVGFRYLQAPADLRRFSRYLLLALVPLVCFGTLFDVLHFPRVEQYGEMAAMTLLLAFAHGYITRAQGPLRSADRVPFP